MKKRRLRGFLIGVGIVLGLLGLAAFVIYGGGEHEGPGTVTSAPTPETELQARQVREEDARAELAVGERPASRILFGDLHVHSTFSADAFMRSLPIVGGAGAHPPADACDFARFCSGLDFFAMTDHAETLTPQHWRETIDSVRECNAVGGDENPDLVAYVGFEWSQVGITPADHYGHKNVIFRGLADDELPARPIGALGPLGRSLANPGVSAVEMATIPIRDFPNRDRYMDFNVFRSELADVSDCPTGVDTRELPLDCREIAETPALLFEKLTQWGLDSLVIPHGSTWGFYTPPGYSWDKQLRRDQRDPERQTLVEVMSGHGNSEEYRDWRAVEQGPDGELVCPEPTDGYEPCCWRAGELIRARCGDVAPDECERRVLAARQNYAAAGVAGHVTVPGASAEDWGNCGQCTDCFVPAFNYRPGASAQYMLARGNFDDATPVHERFGFIASSDNHMAQPGTGYKELARMAMTEATGAAEERWRDLVMGDPVEPSPESQVFDIQDPDDVAPFRILDLERQSSFFLTGGLVGVHAEGRSRQAIWDALRRREVYGTSGPRILLWFDLVSPDGERHPMGSELTMSSAPHFEIRATGAFAQRPGCPDWVGEALDEAHLQELCLGECYYPTDERLAIDRLEIVRIRPQLSDDEPVGGLIEDAWRVIQCEGDEPGCYAEFTDPDFLLGGRDVLYYVRAVQETTLAVNADGLRCQGDDCSSVDPCYGDYRTARDDDCLAPNQERAWSSPIWVDWSAPPSIIPALPAPTTPTNP